MYLSHRLTFEFPATGGIINSQSFRTVKLLRYVTPWDYFILACELIFVAFIIYYIVEEILEIRVSKLKYFKSIWNILDMTVITVRVKALLHYRVVALLCCSVTDFV